MNDWKRPSLERHRKAVEFGQVIKEAIMEDTPLTPDEVVQNWDDVFLTNVVVPIVEHMMVYFQDQARHPGDLEDQEYGHSAASNLRQTIFLLKEWRG